MGKSELIEKQPCYLKSACSVGRYRSVEHRSTTVSAYHTKTQTQHAPLSARNTPDILCPTHAPPSAAHRHVSCCGTRYVTEVGRSVP